MTDIIYVLDQDYIVRGFLSNAGADPKAPFYEDNFVQDLATGADTFNVTGVLTPDNSKYLKGQNHLLFKYKDEMKLFTIITADSVHKDGRPAVSMYAETTGLDLLNDSIRACIIEGGVDVFLNTILENTNFEVGKISSTLQNKIKTIVIGKAQTRYTALQEHLADFDMEIAFRVELENNMITHFYVDAYAEGERGRKTYKRFEYSKNIDEIHRKEDWSEFATCLIGVGENGLSFRDIEWTATMGKPIVKPLNQDFIVNNAANLLYNSGRNHITRPYETKDTDENSLLENTVKELERVSKPHFDYSVNLVLLQKEYENMQIGDTVYVIDNTFYPPVQLEARISSLEVCLSDGTQNKCVLSNYKRAYSKLNDYNRTELVTSLTDLISRLGVGKLTDIDIATIKDYLAQMGLDKAEIEALFNSILKNLMPNKDLSVPEDIENYDPIYLENLAGGFWLGDERIYDVKNTGLALTNPNSSSETLEYKNALELYTQHDLGKNKNKPELAKVMDENNEYKLPLLVRFWAKRFALDEALVYAVIMAESGGNPYDLAAAYGVMQLEMAAYENHAQTLKFLDGTPMRTFTPTKANMKPEGKTTVNGISVDKGINHQVMMGCWELREALDYAHGNIFAGLIAYNMGKGAMDWIVCKYVADKNNLKFVNTTLRSKQSNKVKSLEIEELEKKTFDFSSYRQQYKDTYHKGAATYVEAVLSWYKPEDGGLPKANVNDKNESLGVYTSIVLPKVEAKPSGNEVREKIVATAKEIVQAHKDKKATYDQTVRTWDYKKAKKRSGTFYGCKNPVCYDCSSFASACYGAAGLKSIHHSDAFCSMGTLVKYATAKDGYKMWKVDEEGIKKALPGDLIMVSNGTVKNPGTDYYSRSGRTHHVIIYAGDRKILHASKWAYPPNAIRYEKIDYYLNGKEGGHCFFLRPYDLAESDKNTTSDPIVKNTEITDFAVKALPGAVPKTFYDDNQFIVTANIGDIKDEQKHPVTCKYVLVHFGINDLTEYGLFSLENIIIALRNKYINTPIFVVKELMINSKNSNYTSINSQIDVFNTKLQIFCMETDNVFLLDISEDLYASGGCLSTNLTDSTGYRFDGKDNVQKYYKAIEKQILATPIYYKRKNKNNAQLPFTDTVNIVMQHGKTYKYGVVQNMTFLLKKDVQQKFWSKLIFTTNKDSEPTKVTQSIMLYLEGTDCVEGQLVAKADTTYTITIMASTTGDKVKEKYYGTVAGICEGGSYTDFEDFIGAEDVVRLAETYYEKRAKFVYNTYTPLTSHFKDINVNNDKSKWTVKDTNPGDDGRYHIDCSTLTGLVYRGLSYADSPYAKATSKVKRNTKYSWSFNFPRKAAEQAEFCVTQGWVLHGVDTTNFTNVEAGDLLFWDRDGQENGRYMSCSHVAICIGQDEDGDTVCIESTKVEGGMRKIKIKENTADKFLFAARVRKD